MNNNNEFFEYMVKSMNEIRQGMAMMYDEIIKMKTVQEERFPAVMSLLPASNGKDLNKE